MLDDVTIRAATGDDAESVAALRRLVYPFLLVSADTIRRDLADPLPERKAGAWVAVDGGGDLAGFASCGLKTWTSETGVAGAEVFVRPDQRRRGIGTALVERIDVHLAGIGARRVQVFVTEDSAGFARTHGYEVTRELFYVSVDLGSLPPAPPVPDGITLATMAEAGPEAVYAADAAASLDEPSDSPVDAIGYDEWLRDTWETPALRRDLSVVALADRTVAAFTFVSADGDRAWSDMTGTLREHRGRGLAKVVKADALYRAAAAGIRTASTSMDRRNEPMRAINTWLGYRPAATQLGMTRTLGS